MSTFNVQMISENAVKLIRSLALKKYRYKHNLFIAEGKKMVFDILRSGFTDVNRIFISKELVEEYRSLLSKFEKNINICDSKEFSKISNLDSPPEIILIGDIPQRYEINKESLAKGIHIYLDQIQDPGNLGTIFRTAEWFGVSSIGLSEGCADYVMPKVIQASMGSFCRIPVWHGELPEFIQKDKVYAADLSGDSVYDIALPANGLLVIGNEGQGLTDYVRKKVNNFIHIPSYSKNIESLNAANATAVILSEWRRQLTLGDRHSRQGLS